MADKNLASITFPGLADSYRIPDYSEDIDALKSGQSASDKSIGALTSRVGDLEKATSDISIEPDDLGLEQDGETGLVYPTYRGVRSENGIPLAASGGGGGIGNSATLAVVNTTGWLAKTVSTGASCILTLSWSSTENGLTTGSGILTVTVGGVVKKTQDVAQGAVSVDVGGYLAAGTNKVKVKISDVYENAKTVAFTITMMELTLTSNFDTSGVFSAGVPVEYTYTPMGAVEKTVYFEMDGAQIGTATVTTSGRQQTYSLPPMLHGAHSLRVWFAAMIDGERVFSNELYYELIAADAESGTPIIASTFRASTAAQYETLSIPYRVYTPESLSSAVTLSADGTRVASLSVDRTEQVWSYRPDAAGSLSLSIACGGVTRTLDLTITPSNVDAHAETDALALHLTSYGRSNSEDVPGRWVDKDNGVEAALSGFNFTSDGWIADGDGVTALRVAGDARVTIPYRPFASDFRSTGKTIEIEFATRNILDYDAEIVSCMSGGRGFRLTAQKAMLASEQSEISTQYKEDEHVRISFAVEKRTENRLMYIYINGIMSGVVQYPDSDDFSQASPVNIVIGSNDVTTDIYCIRVYDNDLTRYQILDNWIADTQNVTAMFDRYDHNNIYDEYGAVAIEKLPKDLPYLVISCPELPQYKGDKKTVSGYYVDPSDEAKSFTFTGAQADVQGTSSQYYPRKNYKIKFSGGFTMTATGSAVPAFRMRSASVPTNTFTFKADVASSEGANNVELARLYNDACPYRTPPQAQDSAIRQGIDGFPIVLFWDDGDSVSFVGKYNFNNDKGTEEVFGFADGDESWEIKNNTGDRVLWKSADFTGTDWLNDFEGRYPDGNTDPAKLAAFAAWLVSTDQSAATGNALASAYTDADGAVHTVDDAAYRLAKFRTEAADWMEMDSAIFYYLFTELFLMVDSRAKNAFPSRLGGDKWCWLPYDFDTAIGINNEGALAFSYNLEDIDTTDSGADVFNGQQSVLWVNLRQAFFEDIKTMYQTLRSTGKLSYPVVEAAFEAHQGKWPEAIFNEDAWFKYIDPLIKDGAASYLAMAQGSKAEQRKWWLYNRFRYMDSKYNAGDALTDTIQLRGYAKADITVTPYADIYPSVKYGSYLVSARGARNAAAKLTNPLDNVNDTEIYIYSASQLASVGDLSGLKVGFADFSMATKLQSIKVGDCGESYENGNLTELYVGNNTLLASVDARNCTALASAVDLSGCANIEHVYFDGTAITSCALPNGGILKTLRLPSTITNLTIRNQAGLTAFYMPSYANITTLRIENCGGAIPVLDILSELSENSRVRLIGFTMAAESTSDVEAFYDYLDSMRGLDENGSNVDKAVVGGTITGLGAITGTWLAKMKERYPNIDIEYEDISCDLNYYSYDGSTLLYTQEVGGGGDGSYAGKPARGSTAQYEYTFIGWATVPNAAAADPNATRSVTMNRNVYAVYTATERTYTVFWKNDDGTVLETDTGVVYGTVPTYDGAEPTNADGATFRGWDPVVSAITGDTVFTAVYSMTLATARYYIDSGTAPSEAPVGTQLADTWKASASGKTLSTPWTIVHYGEDGDMYLGWACCTPVSIQFDAPEAIWYADENGLAPGTYHIDIGKTFNGWNASKSIQFTLEKPLDEGDQIFIDASRNENDPTASKPVRVYAKGSLTVKEETTTSNGTDGISLGSTSSVDHYHTNGRVNSIMRVVYGYNRWSQSAIRQYLNSDGDVGEWWAPQSGWDRPPSNLSSVRGFLAGCSEDLLALLEPVEVVTALSTKEDLEEAYETTEDKIFLPSLQEIYYATRVEGVEGVDWDYYKACAKEEGLSGRISGSGHNYLLKKRADSTASGNTWLRTPEQNNTIYCYYLTTVGGTNSDIANAARYTFPACRIRRSV